MTKQDINNTLRAAAEKHGFTTEENNWCSYLFITEPESHYLNFIITEEYVMSTDRSKPEAKVLVHIRASIASMGGNPTPDELIKASEIIREGAELVKELEAMNLNYIETF